MMLRLLLLFVITNVFVLSSVVGQGIVRGKVTDDYGESLIGATVFEKSNPIGGTSTDFDGNYSLKIKNSKTPVIVVSYISYQTIEEKIDIGNEKVFIKDFSLKTANVELEDVVVVAKADRSRDVVLKSIQMKSVGTFDYISKETIAKTGDSHVDDAVKRVTGVSTVQGFITVRGLSDRYVKTTVNGSRIPTLDPFTNNLKLDIFPTALIDNVIISKTQSPDLPGDWAGAYIDIATKDYPDKFSLTVKSSFGYNTQTTFRNVLTSQKSSTDWLGYDNGFRDLGGQYNEETFPWYNNYEEGALNGMKFYDEFVALGLEDYMKSLGINSDHLGTDKNLHDMDDNIYYRLGLVKLDLLAPGYFYDEDEVSNASVNYRKSGLRQKAFEEINVDLVEFSKSMPTNWTATNRKAPLDYSQDITIGNQIYLWGKPLGFLAGFRYSSSVVATDWPVLPIYYLPTSDSIVRYYERQETIETNKWNALLSASYKLTPNHSIKLLFMPNFTGINRVRYTHTKYLEGSSAVINENRFFDDRYELKYQERKQILYQMASTHYFPWSKLKIDVDVSFTKGENHLPAYRDIKFYATDSLGAAYSFFSKDNSTASKPEAIYQYLYDNILDAHITGEIPVFEKPGLARRFKFGGAYLLNKRNTESFTYELQVSNSSISNPDNFFKPEIYEVAENSPTIPFYYHLFASEDNFTIGERKITSGFAMLDYSVISRLRVMGGLRVEYSDMFTDFTLYRKLGYPAGDKRRKIPSTSGQVATTEGTADPSVIKQFDYLPSVNVLYKILDNKKTAFNLRLNYGKSLVRPSIREVSRLYTKDITLNSYVIGNPDLKVTKIDNYDIRFESFFKSGEYISLSGFKKFFYNPIVIEKNFAYEWRNAENSKLNGIELEGKKQIIGGLFFGANATYVFARSKFIHEEKSDSIVYRTPKEHPMYGQAPYILNVLLDYTFEKQKLLAAFSYNVQGPRLVVVSSPLSGLPDIYELPRKTLDFKVTKGFGKHFEVELKIRNILNAPVQWKYDGSNLWNTANEKTKLKSIWKDAFGLDIGDYPFIWNVSERNYTEGVNFTFGISYKL